MKAAAAARIMPALVWAAAALALWQSGAWLLQQRGVALASSKLPYPYLVAEALFRNAGSLLAEAAVTLLNACEGFLLGAAAGVALALLMSLSATMERIAAPYAVASQMVPILGLAPIVYAIFRDENTARVLIAGYISFFPVALHTLRGLQSVRQEDRDLLHVLACGRSASYRVLRLPAALPGMFTGLKAAAPLAVTGAILVELMGAQRGIGVLMLRHLYYGPTHAALFWCTVLLAAALGIAAYGITAALENTLLPWSRTSGRRQGRGLR